MRRCNSLLSSNMLCAIRPCAHPIWEAQERVAAAEGGFDQRGLITAIAAWLGRGAQRLRRHVACNIIVGPYCVSFWLGQLIMSGPQFLHLQSFSRKPNKIGQSVQQVLDEAARVPKSRMTLLQCLKKEMLCGKSLRISSHYGIGLVSSCWIFEGIRWLLSQKALALDVGRRMICLRSRI